jgi:outer membrane protein
MRRGMAVAMVATAVAGAARSETLADAIASAYRTNPTLQQARAAQRALDETDVQARAGWRPTVSVLATDDYEKVFGTPSLSVNNGGASLALTQPIYTGGRTASAVQAADASVAAGRQNLRATEQQILAQVITAYADVLRDQALFGIRQEDVTALNRVENEIAAKREVGQITRTDVAQIQAQLAAAVGASAAAEAQLQISRAEYAALVGHDPGELAPPPPLPRIPSDPAAAFEAAETDNPMLKQAALTEASSRARIAEARAAYMPSVSVSAQLGYNGSNEPAQIIDYSKALSAQVVLTQPLYTGGATGSALRQAIQQNAADREAIEVARRQVVQAVSQSWNNLAAQRRLRTADGQALSAAQLELTGMQEEYRLALRTTLEVLNADETVRGLQINIASADHDAYVSEANLLAAVGHLQVDSLVPDEPLYDSTANFNKVRNRGATPYEPLISALDQLTPGAGAAQPIPLPRPAPGSPVLAPGALPSIDAPLITHNPVGWGP